MLNNWAILPKIDQAFIDKFNNYHKIILQLLANRKLFSKEQIENFLFPKFEKNILDPFLFSQMLKAVDLIVYHIKAGNNITVYGDYDADGVTASAALVEILKTFKANVNVYLPKRFSEGYGLNNKAIKFLADNGCKLIITVDTGIRNQQEVEEIKKLGLDVIITDHHQVPEDKNDWPDCLIINPMAENYPTNNLAGVGVAFKLVQALISKAKLSTAIKNRLEEKVLDLVAIGTIADCVSLLGENRILVNRGLKILNQGGRLGLKELIKVANSNSDRIINSWMVGWQISPRLNSAGRLDHANTAYELLITKDKDEALKIALDLNEKNKERQKITEEIVTCCQQIINNKLLKDKILILTAPGLNKEKTGKNWPEGVIGLVAGRLSEQYYRPVLVITQSNDEIKGSGRSIEEFDIIQAIEQTKEFLSKFGGHAAACGFSLEKLEDLDKFIKKIKKVAAEKLKEIELKPKINIEAELDLSDIDEKLVRYIENLEPFGQDNPRPIFLSRNLQIREKVAMGLNGQHIKFRINGFWAVGFGQFNDWQDLQLGDKIDLVYYAEFNNFNGKESIQLKILDIKRVNA